MSESVLLAPSGISYPLTTLGEGEPLLLLHGFTGSRQTWQPLQRLLPPDLKIMAVDLPGHGQSVTPPGLAWSFHTVVTDLAWLIQTHAGGAAGVLGYSMGGRIALALALTHPGVVRTLILESASPGIADAHERQARRAADAQLANKILREGVPAFVATWERLTLWASQTHLPASVRDQQRAIRLGQTPAGLASSLRFAGTGAQPSYWDQLPDLAIPALLIAGEQDGKFASIATEMHWQIPDSTVALVHDAGHAVHLEQPDDYAQLVTQILVRTTSGIAVTGGTQP